MTRVSTRRFEHMLYMSVSFVPTTNQYEQLYHGLCKNRHHNILSELLYHVHCVFITFKDFHYCVLTPDLSRMKPKPKSWR